MKVFIDFDDTFFNTADFIRDYQGIFEGMGISSDMYQKTSHEAYHHTGNSIEVYDMEAHVRALSERVHGIKIDAVRQAIEVFLVDTSHYVFPEMKAFLEKARAANIKLYILSFGQSDFQRKKIQGTGLMEYFQEVFIVQEKKYAPILASIEHDEEVIWFFDDRAEFVSDVKDAIPTVKTVQVSRPEGRYHDDRSPSADFLIQDFSAIVGVFSREG